MKNTILFIFFVLSIPAVAQSNYKTNTRFLKKLLISNPGIFDSILNHPTHKEVQILYTRINRDKNNVPHFRSYSYNMDSQNYFYPASNVKLPTAIFALEKINELNIQGLTRTSSMLTDSAFRGQTKVKVDSSSQNRLPAVEHYIKKILLTSDNDACNRLFEFVGRQEINAKLKKYGATESRILNRLAIGDIGESTRHSNPVKFYNGNDLVYTKTAQYDSRDYPLKLKNLVRGKGYIDNNDQLIMQPYSFENKNVFTIWDQQFIMRKLMFPEAFTEDQRFKLKADDYELIYKYMSMYPTESEYPKYDPKEFWPLYTKFLYYGRDKNVVPDPKIRIFNKYGDSYGYVIDNSYFVDFENKVEFLLTAVVQSNNDEIYNDNLYEYESVCYPFLKKLGEVIYKLEHDRNKRHLPVFDSLKALRDN